MTGKWEEWLRSWRDRPVPRLAFQYQTGTRGSLTDFSGDLLFVLFARSCSTCRDVVSKLAPVAQQFSAKLLVLNDQTMGDEDVPDAVDSASNPALVTASASFPEIYLGFNIPRGVWLKYPTLFLLDSTGRICVTTDVPEQMTDIDWLKDRIAECTTVQAGPA